MRHSRYLALLALGAIVWTWPLAAHFRDAIPGAPGDNYSFLWNLWWMRYVLAHRDLGFFHSTYLFHPFGVDLVNHPHTALQGLISATLLSKLSIVEAENLYIVGSVFLNAAAAYALAVELTGSAALGLLAGVAFGDSPYVAAHLYGHFDLLTAWTIPLFALFFRRALQASPTGSWKPGVMAGACVAVGAYTAYYHVVYMMVFAAVYALAWAGPDIRVQMRSDSSAAFTTRLVAIGLIALDVFVMVWIWMTGGTDVRVGSRMVTVHGLQNPLFVMWLLVALWAVARWTVVVARVRGSGEASTSQTMWQLIQALLVVAATFALLTLPLIMQAVRLALSGRYVTQTYFWRSAPRGIDLTSLISGNPFNPIVGPLVTKLYAAFGLNRIEQVAWLGLAPLLVLLARRGQWSDPAEAGRWKIVLAAFLLWALGPYLMAFGRDLGLPLPEVLARFIPLVDNARVPGRAMIGVYLSLAVLMSLRFTKNVKMGSDPILIFVTLLVAFDFFNAPMAMTALDRPAVYERLAAIDDNAPVIEVPFGIGDGLTTGIGSQERRTLYYATIHQHPLIGGYIGRMPPGAASAYAQMPVVGNLLRLSDGAEADDRIDRDAAAVPFRYLVLDTRTASPELVQYVRTRLDADVIEAGAGKELYAVQGLKARTASARRF